MAHAIGVSKCCRYDFTRTRFRALHYRNTATFNEVPIPIQESVYVWWGYRFRHCFNDFFRQYFGTVSTVGENVQHTIWGNANNDSFSTLVIQWGKK
jgi:hypothetical protein